MPLARDLHPEFGYIGSAPKLFRKLGLVSAFVAFGLMAGVSGIAVFMAGPVPIPCMQWRSLHPRRFSARRPLLPRLPTPWRPRSRKRSMRG